MSIIVLEGANLFDECFDILLAEGPVCWNVTKIQHQARLGAFGAPFGLPMSLLPPPNHALGFLDPRKIDAIKRLPDVLHEPCIFIEAPEPGHYLCCVDGNHRLTARYELGLLDFHLYSVPQSVERDYRITQRTLP